jgi:DNA-binding phage protein
MPLDGKFGKCCKVNPLDLLLDDQDFMDLEDEIDNRLFGEPSLSRDQQLQPSEPERIEDWADLDPKIEKYLEPVFEKFTYEILKKLWAQYQIKMGRGAAEVARKYGLNEKTIAGLLRPFRKDDSEMA